VKLSKTEEELPVERLPLFIANGNELVGGIRRKNSVQVSALLMQISTLFATGTDVGAGTGVRELVGMSA
jgi:hypothetical protein